MDRIQVMVEKIFNDELDPSALGLNDLELVLDYLYEAVENLLGTDKHEVAVEMLEVLQTVVDDKLAETDMSEFADAVEQAEARGSSYFEFDNYTLH